MDFPANSHDEHLNKVLRQLDSAEVLLEEWISYALVFVKYDDYLLQGKRLSKYSGMNSQIAKSYLQSAPRLVEVQDVCWMINPSAEHKELKERLKKLMGSLQYAILAGVFTTEAQLLEISCWGTMPRRELDVRCNEIVLSNL